MSNRVHSCDICLRFTSFWKCYPSRNTDSLDQKRQREQNEKRLLASQNSVDREQAHKTTHLQTRATLHGKGSMTPKDEL